MPTQLLSQTIEVAPVRVIADLQDAEERALCSFSSEINPDYVRLGKQRDACQGTYSACVRTEIPPNPEPFYLPVYLGSKIIPGLESEMLTQRLRTLLLTSLPTEPGGRLPRSLQLVATLSEIRLLSQKEVSGLGTIANPLGIFLLPFTSQQTARTGYARFDVELVDRKRGRIVEAFRTLGVQRGEYTSESLLGGFQLEPEGFARKILIDAALSGLTQVAERMKQHATGDPR